MGEHYKEKYIKGVRWLVGSAMLALTCMGGWLVYLRVVNQSGEPVAVSAIAVELGTVEISVSESGIVELGGQQTLKSPTDGTVDRVLVEVGDRVKSGEQLITLRNSEQQTTLAIQPLEIQKKQLSLANKRQQVLEAEKNLEAAKEELQALTDSNIEREAAIATERLNLQEKELVADTNRQKLIEAQEDLAAAQQDLDNLINEGSLEIETKLADLKLEIEQQKLTLANERQKVVAAQADLAATQQELEELEQLAQKGFIPGNELRQQQDEIRRQQSVVRDAQLTVNTATLELQRLELKRQQIESEFEDKVSEVRKVVQMAGEAVRDAEERFRTATFERQRTRIALEKITLAPENQLEEARKALREAESTLREAIAQAQVENVELARLELESQKIQQQVEDNVVSAPIDGIVLDVKVKDGDGIARGSDLLTLGDSSQEFVKLQLSTLNAAKVQPNQEARISVIGPDAEMFAGVVDRLSPLATSGNREESSSALGQASVSATIKLKTPTRSLIPGSQVSVEIIVQEQNNVVVLPIEAIARDAPQPYVWVKDPQGKAQKQTLTLGLEGVTEVEVTSGLNPGQTVLLPPPEAILEPGMPVEIEQEASENKKDEDKSSP